MNVLTNSSKLSVSSNVTRYVGAKEYVIELHFNMQLNTNFNI